VTTLLDTGLDPPFLYSCIDHPADLLNSLFCEFTMKFKYNA